MKIGAVRRQVREAYPELKRVIVIWNNEGTYAGEAYPAHWALYTYLDSEQGLLGIESAFTPSVLEKLTRKSLEAFIKLIRTAFEQRIRSKGG